MRMFHHVISLEYKEEFHYSAHSNNTVEITDSSIIGTNMDGILIINNQTKFNITAVLRNLQFYKIQKSALQIVANNFTNILIKSCTFKQNRFSFFDYYNSLILITMIAFNSKITFSNCNFYQNNDWESLMKIVAWTVESNSDKTTYLTVPNIIFERCEFIENASPLLEICDPVCEKGSYSLSNCIYMVTHNLTVEYGTSLQFGHSTTLTWQ